MQETRPANYIEFPLGADVWKSIKDNIKKNRERNSILRILSLRISLHDTNHSISHISVVDEKSTSCNAEKS